jgi:peptidoglycan/LPS O-acetylase OafA/YrhL
MTALVSLPLTKSEPSFRTQAWKNDRNAYRADIDGLRAVAVISVVMFHAAPAVFPGGFVGVDMFFVVSGFLITSTIAVEMRAGTFSMMSFYDRRARRILPALVALLAACVVLGYLILWPGDYADLGRSMGYAAAGLANIFFRNETGYFDQKAGMQPLLHLWSLGVEEQFYLVWPPVLFLLLRVFRLKLHATLAVLCVMTVAAFVMAVMEEGIDPKAAFFLTPFRAWELGVGCVLALLPAVDLSEPAKALAALAGSALIGYAIFGLDASSPFPGLNALFPCLGAALLIWSGEDRPSLVGRCLSWYPVRLIGLISYSLYLIHWPALVFVRHYNNGFELGPVQLALTLASCVAMAWVSWRYIEQPFRKRRTSPGRTVAVGGIVMMAVIAGGVGLAASSGMAWRLPERMRPMVSRQVAWQWTCPRALKLDKTFLCQFGGKWSEARQRAFLWGDSHAEHLAPLLEAASGRTGTAYVLNRRCPVILGGILRLNIPENQDYNNNARCVSTRRSAMDTLRSHPEIETVILASAWPFLVKSLRREPPTSEQDGYALLRDGLQEAVNDMARPGRKIVVIGDFPYLRTDPIQCLAGEVLWRRRCDRKELGISAAAYDRQQGKVNAILRSIAATNPNVSVIIPGAVLCKSGTCQTEWDGDFLYRDTDHIRRNLEPATRASLALALGL